MYDVLAQDEPEPDEPRSPQAACGTGVCPLRPKRQAACGTGVCPLRPQRQAACGTGVCPLRPQRQEIVGDELQTPLQGQPHEASRSVREAQVRRNVFCRPRALLCLLLFSAVLSVLLFQRIVEEVPAPYPRHRSLDDEKLESLEATVPDDSEGCPETCADSKPCIYEDDTVRDSPGFKFNVVDKDRGKVEVDLTRQDRIHFEVRFLVEVEAPDRSAHLIFSTPGGHIRKNFDPRNRPYTAEVVLPGDEVTALQLSSSRFYKSGSTFEVKLRSINFKKDTIIFRKKTRPKDVIFRVTLLTIKPETPTPGEDFVFRCDATCQIPIHFKNDDFCDCPGCEDEPDTGWTCDTCGTSSTSTSRTTTTTTSSSTSSSTSSTTSSSTTSSSSSTTSSSSSTTSSSTTSASTTSSTTTSSTTTSSSTTSSSATSSTTSSTTTTTRVRRPRPKLPPKPTPDAVVASAVGTSLAGALGIALGVGLGLAPALAAIFVANGQVTISVPDPDKFKSDSRASRALKKAIAELAGPEVTEAAVTLAFGCIATARGVVGSVRIAGRLLQQMLDICFQVELQGQETSEEVCQRLSSFDSSVAARIINRYLAEEGLDPSAVEVVRWNADPNPTAGNPSDRPFVTPGDQDFTPPSGVNFGRLLRQR